MFFTSGRMYYTRTGQSGLLYRSFVPESGIFSAASFTATGNLADLDFSKVGGMVLSGSKLYYVTRNDGVLHQINWNGTVPVAGTSVPISGPAIDGINWTAPGLFQYALAPSNQPPTAKAAANCTGLVCQFSSSGSTDPDGTISAYLWNFGDGGTATSASPTHTYGNTGTYTVKLTLTDNKGAQGSTTISVRVRVR
jgi:PKD repeat protein